MPMPAHLKPKPADLARAISTDAAHDVTTTDAEATELLGQFELDATWDEEAAGFAVELWDEVSPINGVDAEWIKENRPEIAAAAADGDVFMVRDPSGHVVQLQWHQPDVEGIVTIPKGQGRAKGEQAKERHVHGRVMQRVVPHVAEQARQRRVAEGKANTPPSLANGIPQPVRKPQP